MKDAIKVSSDFGTSTKDADVASKPLAPVAAELLIANENGVIEYPDEKSLSCS